jgi:ribosomal protein S27E
MIHTRPRSPPVDPGMPMRIEHIPTPSVRSGFKVVCNDCGSLSIKVADPVNAPETTPVQCGRCGTIRGTLADLHDLARRGRDVFEF